jgi:hypothetical protein
LVQVVLGLGIGLVGLGISMLAVEFVMARGVDVETPREKFIHEQLDGLERQSGGFSSEEIAKVYERAPAATSPSSAEVASVAKAKARPWSLAAWIALGVLLRLFPVTTFISSIVPPLFAVFIGYPVVDAMIGLTALTLGWGLSFIFSWFGKR